MDFDFVNRANAEYIDQLYQQFQRDPRSVDANCLAGTIHGGGTHLIAFSPVANRRCLVVLPAEVVIVTTSLRAFSTRKASSTGLSLTILPVGGRTSIRGGLLSACRTAL